MTQISGQPSYIGRFAPSPTGDLHFGSLVSAVASYLQAKSQHGCWLVRIEDIDPPREIEGSSQRIIENLKRFGMESDRPVLYQRSHLEYFKKSRETLLASGHAFACSCSRKDLPAGGVYPGTCRGGLRTKPGKFSIRVKTCDKTIEFHDHLQGIVRENLTRDHGDFVIWRADDLPAYQLAVVMDDALQGVTEIVRGADLIDSTCKQIHLQNLLGLPTPEYIHLPVATVNGKKLGKRFQSDPVAAQNPAVSLKSALNFLGHQPPEPLELTGLWSWAIDHWNIKRVPAVREIALKEVNGLWV